VKSRYSRRAEGKEKANSYPLFQRHVQAMDQGDWKDDNNYVTDDVEDRLRYGQVDDASVSAGLLRMTWPS